MKFIVIAMAICLLELVLCTDGTEVNNTEVKPTKNDSSPEKRSIGSLLLPLLGGLTGLGNDNSYSNSGGGGGGGLLGLIGSMLSNRMGLGGGGLKVDFNSKPISDNYGESSNSYGGSSGPSSQGPGIAFNLDFGRIHDNLEKGLRIGKAAVTQGGSWLTKLLQPASDNGYYGMNQTPLRSAYQEYLPQDYAVGPPPRYLRSRAPSSYPVRGSSAEASYIREAVRQSRPKLSKNYASQKTYPEIVGRIKQQQAYMDSGLMQQPTYSESIRGTVPRYPDDSLSAYPEMAAESHETYSGIRYSSQQSPSQAQHSYPEENEISTGNYQRNEYSSSFRPSTLSPYRGNSMDQAGSTPKSIQNKNIQQAVAIPISVYEASKNYNPDMGNMQASEYQADYEQSNYGQGSESRNYEGMPMVQGAEDGGNYYGSDSGSYASNGQASSTYEQQQHQQH